MSNSIQDILALLGRILFALIFVLAGFDKIFHFSQTAAFMAEKGVTLSELWLCIAIIMELGGGLMILLGLWARIGAALIFLFILPVTYVFHSFWGYDASEAVNQLHHFLKNITLLGGSLYILAYGSGKWSIDRCCCRR